MGVDERTLDEIVRRILSVASPERITLFGSAAAGEMSDDSDIDLLRVEKKIADRRREYLQIRRALRDIPFPFDIVLISAKWYDASKDIVGGIAHAAYKQGRVLYAAA